MATASDEPPDAASDQPAVGDQASGPDLPSCSACTHLKKAEDPDQDQDRYLINVRYDLSDAFENLTSSEPDVRAESHEALRRTLRIWLKHRADDTHPIGIWDKDCLDDAVTHHPLEPEYLVNLLQYGYLKDELSFNKLEPQDMETIRYLREVSADLGLKVFLVLWKLTAEVVLKHDYEDHVEVLEEVPAGASTLWHKRSSVRQSSVEIEKLVDLDDESEELGLQYLPASLKDRLALTKRCIQKYGDIFYDNNFMKWEDMSSLSWSSPGYAGRGRDGSPVGPVRRAICTQYFQSCAVLLVPQEEYDCFRYSQIDKDAALDDIWWHLEQSKIPETRYRAIKTLRHLVAVSYGDSTTFYFDDDELRTGVIQVALDNLDYKLFSGITGQGCSGSHSPVSFGQGVFQAVHKAMAKDPHFKFAEVSDSLLNFVKRPTETKTTYNVVEMIVDFLWVLAPTGDGVPLRPDVLSWIVEAAGPLIFGICRAPESSPATYETGPDGRAIVDLLVRYYPRASLTRLFKGILTHHAYNMSFMLGALAQIDRYVDEGAYDQEEARAIYQKLAKSTIEEMHSPLFKGASKDRSTTALLDAKNMASLFNNCLKYQWEDLTQSLISLMYEQLLDNTDISDLQEYWVPGLLFSLLHLLPDSETESSPRLGTTEQRMLAQCLVHNIISRFSIILRISPFPTAPDYWRHPVSCANHCELCNELNSFLQSHHQAKSFVYDAPDVDHMTLQIKGCEQCKFVDEPFIRPDLLSREQQHILVVTKTAQTPVQWKATWQARSATWSEFVAKLKEEPFQTRLDVLFIGQGDSTTSIQKGNISGMPKTLLWEKLPAEDVMYQPLGRVEDFISEPESSPPPSLAGSKRKAEDQGGREISGKYHGGC